MRAEPGGERERMVRMRADGSNNDEHIYILYGVSASGSEEIPSDTQHAYSAAREAPRRE